jgi:trimethylamine-N-oxide reductase (cytochrome c)
MGEEEDDVPKTPEWASKKCGVPEWTIKALARQFAKRSPLLPTILEEAM